MVLTRGQNQAGPDGVLGNADDIQDADNTDTPLVDQSQTYTSHGSHQAFLREYELDAANHPMRHRPPPRRSERGQRTGHQQPARERHVDLEQHQGPGRDRPRPQAA